jgi:aspartate/methionine/tyrosine aminotransferase
MDIPYKPPQGAFYVFPEIKKFGMNSEDFCGFSTKQCKGLQWYRVVHLASLGEGYVRFSYTADYELIKEGWKELKRLLKDFNLCQTAFNI